MKSTTQVIYQPCVAGPRGSLMAGTAVVRCSPEEALRRAERVLQGGSILGTHIVQVTHDADANEFGEPSFFCRTGRVPDVS